MVPAMNAEPFSPEVFAALDERLDRAMADQVWWSTALGNDRRSLDS